MKKNDRMNLDFQVPEEFFKELPRNEDDLAFQFDERHELFNNIGCFPKRKEKLFREVHDSTSKWVCYPVTPEKMYISERGYSIGLSLSLHHPEICLKGKVGTKELQDIFYSLVTHHLPLEEKTKQQSNESIELTIPYGYNVHYQKTVTLRFRKIRDLSVIQGEIPECFDFYKWYFDNVLEKMLSCIYVADLPKELSAKFDAKKKDELNKEEQENVKKKGKSCWKCGLYFEDPSKLSVCSRCGKAKYCSRKCQVDDWKSHKKNCKI